MDFVITENFLSCVCLDDDIVSILVSFDLFVNKKASYILDNYEILDINNINHIESNWFCYPVHYIYNAIKKIYNMSPDSDGLLKFDLQYSIGVKKYNYNIIADKDGNILSSERIAKNYTVSISNTYENGRLVATKKDSSRYSNFIKYITYYEYYDNGVLYKSSEIYENKIFLNGLCSYDEKITGTAYYDIFGREYKNVSVDSDKITFDDIEHLNDDDGYQYAISTRLSISSKIDIIKYEQRFSIYKDGLFIGSVEYINAKEHEFKYISEHVINGKTFSIIEKTNCYILHPKNNYITKISELYIPIKFNINYMLPSEYNIHYDNNRLKLLQMNAVEFVFDKDECLQTINYIVPKLSTPNIEFLKIKR